MNGAVSLEHALQLSIQRAIRAKGHAARPALTVVRMEALLGPAPQPTMSEPARELVEDFVFWLERANAGSVNAGRPSYWRQRCYERAAELIGKGC